KGADDYLLKPCSIDELNIVLNQIIKQRNLKNENIELKRQLEKYRGVSAAGMIGRSSAMRQVYERIEAVAKSESTVLIIGETGTGKDLVAHDIHKQSSRKDRPFVKLDCAALPETLLESELFGHEKGAFTGASKSLTGRFEQANGGLLFLDEIGNMSLATQAKLLNVIQDREFTRIGGDHKISVDIRLLCATNTDLERAVAKGEFREDLYYRLNVVPIRVPPLRERRDDIPILASHFLNRFQTSNNRGPMTISRDALDLLYSFNWPGNVRELENVVERLVILSKGNEITVSNLPSRILNIEKKNVPFSPHIEMKSDETLREAVESFEAQLIHDTLDEMNGSRDKTASKLGISRITLYNKMKRYGFLDSD
ncbi:MAG TPA: sigma-54 dependent transcriptional regulator, partial [bacterium]|nr:sigma-54 dependent transcriptional regulator [bacterium]